jgi:hypothetical protein
VDAAARAALRGGAPRAVLARTAAPAAALALCLFHFASFDPFRQTIVTDIRYFLYIAWRITEGAVPHLDVFENKTQLASFVGALLYALGDAVGADPLYAIRIGYLGIAAAGGLLAFSVQRRLFGSAVAGLLGALAYCGFGLLGALPAIGNVPKLLMAVFASAAAVLAHGRHWFWAGVAGALSFMDWQVGALAWLGVFAAALVGGAPRGRALLATLAGGVAGVAPFVVYYAASGALLASFDQVILASFFRGASAAAGIGVTGRLERMAMLVPSACAGHEWLLLASAAGVAVVVAGLVRWRDPATRRLLVPLAVYHFGVLGFSLVDFQWYGDFFLLLHSAAFFLGVAASALYCWCERRVLRAGPHEARLRLGFAGAALAFGVLLARPGPLRPEVVVEDPTTADPRATLADQRAVAGRLAELTAGRRLLALESSEILFLMRRANAIPPFYWNAAAHAFYRRDPAESSRETLTRLVREVDPDVLIHPLLVTPAPGLLRDYRIRRLVSANGLYRVVLLVRPEPGASAGRGPE